MALAARERRDGAPAGAAAPPAAPGIPRAPEAAAPPGAWGEALEAQAAARHHAAASDFRDVLLRMRREAPRGEAFARGLRSLLACGMQAGTVAYLSMADFRLQGTEGWARQLGGDLRRVLEDRERTGSGQALRQLSEGLERYLAEHSPCPDCLGSGFDWLDPTKQAPPLGKGVAVRLVYLPIALYVRNSIYLYELLSRLRAAPPPPGKSTGAAGDGPARARLALDAGGLGFSFMAYAVCAALQALLLLRRAAAAGRGPAGGFPLELLGSSAPSEEPVQNPHPMAALGTWAANRRKHGRALIFRGLWVGRAVDEERLRFQRSMNSWSRSFQGALRVLDFYAEVEGSPTAELAHRARHALVYVMRVDWADERGLALPLQLFEGPVKLGTSEREVTIPPYARYELEGGLEVSSEDFGPGGEGEERLEELRRRWGKDLHQSAPPLVEALHGSYKYETLRKLRPKLSLRFVRDWTLAEPLRELFSAPEQLLYAFPPGAP